MLRVFCLCSITVVTLLSSGCQNIPSPQKVLPNPLHLEGAASAKTIENLLYRKISRMRRGQNLKPFETDEDLAAIARRHSRDMVQKNYFGHMDTQQQTPTDRGLKDGYVCRIIEGNLIREGIAENIFKTSLYSAFSIRGKKKDYEWREPDEIAESILQQWLASEGHARNLLSEEYSATGIGAAVTMDYQILITQDFC